MQTIRKLLWIPALMLGVIIMNTLTLQAADKPRQGKLQHVVSFKFKDSASPEKIDELVQAFGALKKKIKEIRGYEWGTNVSPEKHDKGFTHVFIATFRSEKDRDAYLVHPQHQEFVKLVGPIVEDVFVVDFWSEK